MSDSKREVKDSLERKTQILNIAQELFIKNGYDSTSIKEIQERTGIARGTLYHHFSSKEEIMDALIHRISQKMVEAANAAACRVEIPVQQRLFLVAGAIRVDDDQGYVQDHLHKPQNALLHQKIQKIIVQKLTPVFVRLIQEGIEEEVFSTPYVEESMEMVLTYVNVVFDHDLEALPETERNRKIAAFVYNLERLLGASEGELSFAVQLLGG